MGIASYETIIGFYFCARSQVSLRESIKKVAQNPILNAFILGCFVGLSNYSLPEFLEGFYTDMRSTFAILGMMLIGLALSGIREFKLNYKFIASTFVSKFIVFPLAFNLFIITDQLLLGWYSYEYYNALQLMCLMPLSTTTILMSSLFNLHPEEMASAAVSALLFALIFIPVASIYLL